MDNPMANVINSLSNWVWLICEWQFFSIYFKAYLNLITVRKIEKDPDFFTKAQRINIVVNCVFYVVVTVLGVLFYLMYPFVEITLLLLTLLY